MEGNLKQTSLIEIFGQVWSRNRSDAVTHIRRDMRSMCIPARLIRFILERPHIKHEMNRKLVANSSNFFAPLSASAISGTRHREGP